MHAAVANSNVRGQADNTNGEAARDQGICEYGGDCDPLESIRLAHGRLSPDSHSVHVSRHSDFSKTHKVQFLNGNSPDL